MGMYRAIFVFSRPYRIGPYVSCSVVGRLGGAFNRQCIVSRKCTKGTYSLVSCSNWAIVVSSRLTQ